MIRTQSALAAAASAHTEEPAKSEDPAKSEAPALPADAALARALLHSAPVAIYHSHSEGNLSYANPEYRRIFGLSPEQSLDDWAQGVHPQDRARMEATWADFCQQPRPMQFEYRTLSRGAVRFISEQVAPAHGVSGFVGTISDFTDLVTARGDLRKAETLFRNTFDQAPIGIAYADRNGTLLRFNGAFCTLLGFTPDELAAKSVGELTHAEDVVLAAAQLERLWSAEIPF